MRRAAIWASGVIITLSACAGAPSEVSTLHLSPTTTVSYEIVSQPVVSNLAWIPHIEDFSGVRMALVPPGCFMMGIMEPQIEYLMDFPSSSMELENYNDQLPAHEVCFEEPFWIDVFEITQTQFSELNGEAMMTSFFSGENLPREQITWFEAQSFCQLRAARLPTEAEWEYATRGPDGKLFPWGDTFDCRNGNFDDTEWDDLFLIDGGLDCDGFSSTSPVGSILEGASWVGVLDLSGNIWEWVADRYQSEYYGSLGPGTINPLGPSTGNYFVVRGGAWSINEADHLSASFRVGIDPNSANEHLGFRCAKSVE